MAGATDLLWCVCGCALSVRFHGDAFDEIGRSGPPRPASNATLGIVPGPSTIFLFTNKKRDSLLMYCADYDGEQTLVKKLEKGGFLLPESSREGESFVIMKPSILARLFR